MKKLWPVLTAQRSPISGCLFLGGLFVVFAVRGGCALPKESYSVPAQREPKAPKGPKAGTPEAFIANCSLAWGTPLDTSLHANGSFRIHWSNDADGMVVTDEVRSCGFEGWESGKVRWIKPGRP